MSTVSPPALRSETSATWCSRLHNAVNVPLRRSCAESSGPKPVAQEHTQWEGDTHGRTVSGHHCPFSPGTEDGLAQWITVG